MIFDKELFIFVEATESNPGAGFILSTSPPFYIGRVIKMDAGQYNNLSLREKSELSNCEGYSVVILRAGSLLNEIVEDERIMLNRMANYYLKFKIYKHEPRYRRYRI
jgi:hypothetical protein